MDSKALYNLSYGLFVLTTKIGDKDNGCITNTAIQVTSEPNQICVAINKSALTCDILRSTGEFNISIISKDATFDLFKRFGFQSGLNVDKFKGFDGYKRSANGITYITEGTNAYMSIKISKTLELGTHVMFIGTIENMVILSTAESATYAYYQSDIKPKPKKVGVAPNGQTIWKCSVCGYEYIGKELPEDFHCPTCNHSASYFEKITK